MKYKWNKDLYKTTGIGKDNKFDVGLIRSLNLTSLKEHLRMKTKKKCHL